MLSPGPARKITIHFNEDTSSGGGFLGTEILALLLREGVAGATMMRPDAGFGSHHRLHSHGGGIESDRHMPQRIEFIETAANAERLLPLLCALVTDGLIEAQDTTILAVAPDVSA